MTPRDATSKRRSLQILARLDDGREGIPMNDSTTITDLFARWEIPWVVSSAFGLSGIVYVRGWVRVRRTRRAQFGFGQF